MVRPSLFRGKTSVAEAPARAGADGRIGIIDIGSNSIRLVVYDGPERVPAVLFNEKVMAGLGRGLSQSGKIEPAAIKRALTALTRFRLLADQIGVSRLRTVATAAVREASNGPDFLEKISALGLEPEVLSGEEEARMAGYGVLSGIPDARGIVGDLGGGSLELIKVGDGALHEGVSLPLGVLRIAALRAGKSGSLDRAVGKMLSKAGWTETAAGQSLYLVGGSWRALARLHMTLNHHPLPIVHDYRIAPAEAQRLVRVLAQISSKKLRDVVGLSSSRIPTLADAAALLAVLVKRLKPSQLVVSAHGLREGLLFSEQSEEVRELDPLICGARHTGEVLGRYPEHGDLLDRWITPLFIGESAADHRLRHAACLLADIGWRAHPEFRAERGLETALHGNWVGVDAKGRAMIAQALYTNFGGNDRPALLGKLCDAEGLAEAERWGLALRLGQRLSAGVAEGLNASRVSMTSAAVRLHLPVDQKTLYGESVERRLKSLAAALGRTHELVIE